MSNYRRAYTAGSTVFLTGLPTVGHRFSASLIRLFFCVKPLGRQSVKLTFKLSRRWFCQTICTLSGRCRRMITTTLNELSGLKFCSRDRSEDRMLNLRRFHLLAASIERAMCGSVGSGNTPCVARPNYLVILTMFITTRLSMAWSSALINGRTLVFIS